jgi:hypothetical protein
LVTSCVTAGNPGAPSTNHSWHHFHSEQFGYSVDYPPDWYDLPNQGAPETEKYFGSKKDIGAPLGMQADEVLLSLSTLNGGCRAAPPGNVDGTAQLTVNGKAVTRVTGFLGPPQSEAWWGSYASVPKGTNCFAFSFVFGGKAARDANLRITDQMISSFTTS